MKHSVLLNAAAALALLAGTGKLAAQQSTAVSILSNGDFETASADGSGPKNWPTPAGVSWLEEEGNHFLRLEANPDKLLMVYRVVPIKPEYKALSLTFRVRANALERGEKMWHDGRIMMGFKNAAGEKLKPEPSHPNVKGTTKGWVDRNVEFLVPEGATQLEFMPAMFNAKSGSLDLDDLVLAAVDPQPIIDRRAEAARKKAEDIARRAALVKPQVPIAPADKLPSVLHVDGNKIKNAEGEEVWLQGVAIPSLEWSAGGDNILRSLKLAIDDWHVNVVRLGVREHFWAGTGPWQSDGGAGYRQLVDDVVNLAGANGIYVVIDLHRFRAPEEKDAAFWREVATRYKNHPAVMFELFNEPHDVSWEVWRDGGFVSTEKKKDTDAATENNEKLKGFESVGMQALINAVRDTGAKNIVIAGALDWAYDLSGILTGYALDDRGGNGIVYASHVYVWKSDWEGKFIKVAEQHPIIITECGATEVCMPFIPIERHEDPHGWVPDFLGLVQKNKYHWTGWSFHPKCSPCLLSDWDYTPTPYWGAYVKDALAGKQFKMKKMR